MSHSPKDIYEPKLSPTEIDVQICATAVYDVLEELMYIVTNSLTNHRRSETRIKFGEAVVKLARAIRADIHANK
jgi:uncharacterized membrane protein YecN with MAPEG domain